MRACGIQILSPEAVAHYVRSHHAAQSPKANVANLRAPLERRLAELGSGIGRIITAIERGTSTDAMEARMMEMDAERQSVELQLAEIVEERPIFELHPKTAARYADMVATLQAVLADIAAGETRAQRQLIDAVRGLIEKIVITPVTQERGGPIDLVLQGTLARFMQNEA